MYVSPEQTGRMINMVDYRTDIYSLGITTQIHCYHLLLLLIIIIRSYIL